MAYAETTRTEDGARQRKQSCFRLKRQWEFSAIVDDDW